ncbi:Glyoxalase-like domain protein [Actinomadura rubteroloni]|uniref:Glyoxalase-like domain protein n=1 Tax=Actinomadura rubteroloni TaxID=1926885 RepID=A0A2P4UJP7_9ACTN|nr:VOC family protein [Actinomadura rubteroloni]POM25272.1 Glyoxalase-like domain protein [Actinomadura rubteroloni]
MRIDGVLAGLAVSDLSRSRRWYETVFDRPADAEPMPGLAEWHTPGGVVQVVADRRRAGGSLVTVRVPDARRALTELAERGGPVGELDDTTSAFVLFASVTDPDGNLITIVQDRAGAER